MTIEAAPMSRQEAERITERIRVALDRVSTAWADLGERITEAYQRRADLALGYGSWQEYAEAELKPTEGLAAEVRRQLVGMLSQAGMSVRSIAPTVGLKKSQVSDIRAQVSGDRTPNEESVDRIDLETGEVLDDDEPGGTWEDYWPTEPEAPKPEPGTVTGLDGKKYRRPEPKPEPAAPKRRALTDQAHDAAINLTAAVDRIARIFADDRLTANKKQVGDITRAHLLRTAEVCQDLANQL